MYFRMQAKAKYEGKTFYKGDIITLAELQTLLLIYDSVHVTAVNIYPPTTNRLI